MRRVTRRVVQAAPISRKLVLVPRKKRTELPTPEEFAARRVALNALRDRALATIEQTRTVLARSKAARGEPEDEADSAKPAAAASPSPAPPPRKPHKRPPSSE